MKMQVRLSGPPVAKQKVVLFPVTVDTGTWIKFAVLEIPWEAMTDPHIVEGVNATVSVALRDAWEGHQRTLPLEAWE